MLKALVSRACAKPCLFFGRKPVTKKINKNETALKVRKNRETL